MSEVEALKAKIAKLENELRATKRQKHISATEEALKECKDFFDLTEDHGIMWLHNALLKELQSAEVYVATQSNYDYERQNSLQSGRYPQLVRIKTDTFGFELKGQNNWTRMAFRVLTPQSKAIRLHRTFYTLGGHDEESFFKDDVMLDIFSTMLDWPKEDDLIFFLPTLTDYFFGVIRSFLMNYISEVKRCEGDIISHATLLSHWP